VLDEVFIPDELTITFSEILGHRFHTPHTHEALYHMDAGTIFHVATFVPVLALTKAADDLQLLSGHYQITLHAAGHGASILAH